MKIYVKSLNRTIELENGVYHIVIENPNIYRNIGVNIESEITLSIDNKIVTLEKETTIVYDPFNIDFNDSKIIKSLYRILEKEMHNSYENELRNIEISLFHIIDKMILNNNLNLDYENQVDVSKLLACLGIKYNTENDYLFNLIQFIKIQYEIFSKRIIIFFGLSNILNKNEIEQLNNELINIDSIIIDFSFNIKISNNTSLIIDEDWCIL